MAIHSPHILLGITGSIAAYKTPELIKLLREQGFSVKVVLTAAGKSFVTPLTLQAVTGKPVYDALLDPAAEASMCHITLARWADMVLIAPTSANFIAKLAQGMADDLLSTLCLATQAPILIAPAMNQAMWSHPATQANLNTLIERSVRVIGPAAGIQACGETGLGRMSEPQDIVAHLIKPFLQGQRILITAGPTQEPLDPVRFLSNRSSGKMGYALAQAAIMAGAQVTLISGPVSLSPPAHCHVVRTRTAAEMFTAVAAQIDHHTIFISAAAVADYCLAHPATEKIKKTTGLFTLSLTPTPDILAYVCGRQPRPFCVGFAAETQDVVAQAKQKYLKKGVDLLVVNDVSQRDIGFDSADNAVIVLSAQGETCFEKAPKLYIAQQILQMIQQSIQARPI